MRLTIILHRDYEGSGERAFTWMRCRSADLSLASGIASDSLACGHWRLRRLGRLGVTGR
jgi:hypothetical protein